MPRHLPKFLTHLLFGIPILFLPLASVAGEVEGKTETIASPQFPAVSEANPMSRIPSVSQLSDVPPTAWAYQALRSLVERYGCIAGYSDRTFRGERALTRYEFAAGLNACWNSIERLLQENVTVIQQDLETLDRLVQEFKPELAAFGARVENLESRVAFLEDNQFSTTVKMSGSNVIALSGALADGFDNQAVLAYRTRLLLNASFTGKDNLLIGLYAGNAFSSVTEPSGFALPGVEGTLDGKTITTSTAEGGLSSSTGGTTDNRLLMLAAKYSFPVGDRLTVHVSAGRAPYYFYAPVLNGLYTGDEGTGAIGVFGRHDPAYLLVSGGTGITLNYNFTDSLELTAGYLADGGTVGDPSPGNGLFNGGYGVLGQLTWNVTKNLSLAAVYVHDYASGGRFGFNSNGLGSAGTAEANTLAGQDKLGGEDFGFTQSAIVTNGYSAQFSWRVQPNFVISGWFGS